MRQKSKVAGLAALLAITSLYGLSAPSCHAQMAATTKAVSAKSANYIDPLALHLDLVLPPPPSSSAAITTAEFAELHRIESARTPAQAAQAKQDDGKENIFLFQNVLGSGFNPEALPLTAAFSVKVRQDESAASSPLKKIYHRPRPYQADATLHPVCPVTAEPNSYPSGHALSGYLLGFTLAQMVPEKEQEILARADEYAHNRLVCGVHYASDTEASRRVAYAIYGALASSPRFQQDLAAARDEVRRQLGLPAAAK